MSKEENKRPKPHCWGKMDWILKYPDGEEPRTSICDWEHGAHKCKALTRENAENKNEAIHLPQDDSFPKC